MGFLETLKKRIGGTGTPTSAQLTQQLGIELGKLNQLDKEMETVRAGLAIDALGDDGGKGSTDRLAQLSRDREARQAIVDALRVEIAGARDNERTAATTKQWLVARGLGDAQAARAQRVEADTERLLKGIKEYIVGNHEFAASLPMRPPQELEPAGKLGRMIIVRLQTALPQVFGRPNAMLGVDEHRRTADISAATREFIDLALQPATRAVPNPGTATLLTETTNA